MRKLVTKAHRTSHAPKTPHRTSHAIEQQVIELKTRHPHWGKRRISDEIAKANNWVPLVSANTVRRILIDAGLWKRIQTQSQQNKPAHLSPKPELLINLHKQSTDSATQSTI